MGGGPRRRHSLREGREMSGRPSGLVPGTAFYPFDWTGGVSRENSMSVSSVPGTEGYGVENAADGIAA
jgi:hypothetical protein